MADFQPQSMSYAWGSRSTPEQGATTGGRLAGRVDAAATLRDYRETDLPEVVALDQAGLGGFMKTRLAAPFKAQYYSLIRAYPRRIFIVAEGRTDRHLVGFVAGYVWPREFEKHAVAQNQRLRLSAIPALLRRPLSAFRLSRETRQVEAEAWSDAPIDPARSELAIIVVHPRSTRRGVGRRLVQEFARRAVQMGAVEVRLTTSAFGNHHANNFFRSLGFELVRVLGDDTTHPMNEYRLAHLRP